MSQLFHKSLQLLKKPIILKSYNTILGIQDISFIQKNLYLGNIESSKNETILKNYYIGAILNCTEYEPFHSYFQHKPTLRLPIQDTRDNQNLQNVFQELENGVHFIDENIKNDKIVLVHCYWGFMRSATVVCAYLMKKYKMKPEMAIQYVREKRPGSLNKMYNFNDLLEEYYKKYIQNQDDL